MGIFVGGQVFIPGVPQKAPQPEIIQEVKAEVEIEKTPEVLNRPIRPPKKKKEKLIDYKESAFLSDMLQSNKD